MDTAQITFLPDGRTVTVDKGTTILQAALDNGVALNHNCGGFCACSSCHVIVVEGFDRLSEISEKEEEQLDEAQGLTLTSRLACQTQVLGDITVKIP